LPALHALPLPGQIRPVRLEDAAAIRAVYAPFVTDSAISFEIEAPTVAEMARRIADSSPSMPWLVFDSNGIIVGYACVTPHRSRAAYRWSVDVAVYVAPGCHGRGVGRALYRELLDTCRSLGFFNVFAGIALPNPGSVALHAAFGFTPIGVYRAVGFKMGRWHDVGWWQCVLRAPEAEPMEPGSH